MKIRNIVFYLRNSTEFQQYQYQKESLQTHLERFNDVKLIKIYEEKISGFKSEFERPQMNQLLNDIKNGGISEVWCNDFQRLSRDANNLNNIVKLCSDFKVNIFFKSNDLYSLDSTGELNLTTRLIISTLALFSEMDAKNFKEKGKQGKLTKVRAGLHSGGILPLGYCYENVGVKKLDKKIIIDEKRKKVVEYIFDSYVNQRKSLNQIANDLNNLKLIDSDFETPFKFSKKVIKAQTSYNWYPIVIQRVIKCTWYALGFRMYKDEKIMLHEDLKFIDEILFNKANALLKTNVNKTTDKKHTYLLKDIIFCQCGCKMKIKKAKQINHTVYQCQNEYIKIFDKNVSCSTNTKSINCEIFENVLWNLIKNKLPEFSDEINKKSDRKAEIENDIKSNNNLIKQINDVTIQNLNETKQRTLSVFSKYGGNETELEKDINEITNQIKQQKNIINDLTSKNTMLLFSIENLNIENEIEQNIEKIESDRLLIKTYINKLISKITVMGGLKSTWLNFAKIEWNNTIIGSISDTYIYFNSRLIDDDNYCFFSPAHRFIKINWNHETKIFNINNDKNNDNTNYSISDFVNKMNSLFAYDKYLKPDQNPLYLYPFNIGRGKIKIISKLS